MPRVMTLPLVADRGRPMSDGDDGVHHRQSQLLDRRGRPHQQTGGDQPDQHEREIFDGRLALIHARHATG